MGRSFTARFNE